MVRWGWVWLALALSGCAWLGGSKEVVEPPAELQEIEARVGLETHWRKRFGVGVDGHFVRLDIALLGKRVFVADRRGRVWAVQAEDGAGLWEVNTDALLAAGVGAGEGLVLVATGEGEVIALDADDGSERWRAQVGSEVLAVPRVDRGIVVVQSADGTIVGLNAEDGERLWIYDRSVPVLTLRGTSSPLLGGGAVLAGFANGKLVALTLDQGRIIWETSVAVPSGRSELERLVDLDGDFVVFSNEVYATTFQGQAAALDLPTGQVRWSRDMSSYRGVGVDFSHVYVSDDQSNLWALNRRNGATLWKQSDLRLRGLSAPAPLDEYVLAGDFEGYVHVFSRFDGALVGRGRVGSAGVRQILAAGDRLYVYGAAGELAALSLSER
jgi:outer membrane protein assembly factor BamB